MKLMLIIVFLKLWLIITIMNITGVIGLLIMIPQCKKVLKHYFEKKDDMIFFWLILTLPIFNLLFIAMLFNDIIKLKKQEENI